jgi:hypothetical protein
VLTFLDSFSRYAGAIPLPDTSAVTCARAYATHIITRHGKNDVLVTDNGKSFTAIFFNEVCKILGVKHYHDGLSSGRKWTGGTYASDDEEGPELLYKCVRNKFERSFALLSDELLG